MTIYFLFLSAYACLLSCAVQAMKTIRPSRTQGVVSPVPLAEPLPGLPLLIRKAQTASHMAPLKNGAKM